jgi:2-methylcitrate dehydratase PrpD
MARKIIDQLVDFMLAARDAALPGEVVQKAKNHLLDTLAAIVSGSQLTPGRLGLIKKFPVGAPMQEAVEAMHRLIERHKIRAVDVAKVIVRLPERAAQTVNNRDMPDVNVQYILAVTLLDGRLSFEAAHDYERMQRPDVQAIKARVHLEVDLERGRVGPRYQALVEVSVTNGQQFREHIVNVRGRPENPMSPAEVKEKARALMTPVLGDDRVDRLFDAIRTLEMVTDISSLRPLLLKL